MALSRSHTVVTTASPEAVWKRWTTPADWVSDDPGVDACDFPTPPTVGARGTLVSGGRQKIRFLELKECEEMLFEIVLPLGSLQFPHHMAPSPEGLRVRHGVRAMGPLGWLYWLVAGRKVAAGLPEVMGLVVGAALAESVEA
ncbi:hypothetical protein [Demequina sp. NBRC 110051]|uniref:hypothetical protein n=1 Tax=Demequina sp. NBRC 110051 TaxID=1570340 RepID=UPI0009FEE2D4|nr:hypothetical protein [Demequina sp. NBRC 110051]